MHMLSFPVSRYKTRKEYHPPVATNVMRNSVPFSFSLSSLNDMSCAFAPAGWPSFDLTSMLRPPISYPMRLDRSGASYRSVDFLETSIVIVLENCRKSRVTERKFMLGGALAVDLFCISNYY